MGQVILVVADALRDDTAAEYLGYLEHLVEDRRATQLTLLGEFPTLSRPAVEGDAAPSPDRARHVPGPSPAFPGRG